MIGTVAFIVFFAGLGLAVVLLAMRGGARGARETLHSQSRGGRRMAFVVLPALMLAFGIGIPAWVVLDNESSKAQDARGGVELNEAQASGRRIFARQCSTCHTLRGADAVGKVGPDLDALRPPKNLTLDAIENGRARGQGQMPAELVDGQEAADVADFIAAVAGR
jgi:mono/diheme cytochrome c family protein